MVHRTPATTSPNWEELIAAGARVLHSEGAREVYVFGSAGTGRAGEESDLDFAVAGLPPDRYFRAVGRLMLLLRREVDVVALESDAPFVQHLKSSGTLRRVG
jgi:predicted nucleotidyltransferase